MLNNIHDDIGNQISAKVLSSSLSVLEEYSLIKRDVDKTSRPIRVRYSLTEMGEDLYIVFGALKGWARKWCRQQNKCCRYSNLVHMGFHPLQQIDVDNFESKEVLYSNNLSALFESAVKNSCRGNIKEADKIIKFLYNKCNCSC